MRKTVIELAILVLAIGSWSWAASPADKTPVDQWPQWQGPNRDNVSTDTGLLQKWPESGPPLLWKATGLGHGYSSVAIAGGHIYTMGDTDDSACIFALDMTGKNLWSAKIGSPGAKDYPGTRSTPTVDGQVVFGLSQMGDLAAVNTADGSVLWKKNLANDFGGKMMSQWGYSESVLVDGDNVICMPGGSNGAFLALNKKTGQQVWRNTQNTDKASYSSFIIATICGQKQYVKLTAAHLLALKPEDGSILWEIERKGQTAVIPTPIVVGDDVWVTSGYGAGSQLFHIAMEGGKMLGTRVYTEPTFDDKHGGDVKVGDYVYGTSSTGIFFCQNFATGKIAWKTREPGLASITAADGKLYVRDEKKTMFLIAASPDAYKEISHFTQSDHAKGENWAHPVVCGGKLYLRDQDILLCYDLRAK